MRRPDRTADGTPPWRLPRLAVHGIVAVGLLCAITGPAAAAGMRAGWTPTVGNVARSIAHLVGIAGGVVIAYYADVIRRKTAGSTVGVAALLTEVGTLLFVLVFTDMEVGHVLGTGLWSGVAPSGVTRLWWMAGLAAMVSLYTLAYRSLLRDIGGG